MTANNQQKHLNQNKEYRMKHLRLQDYHKQLKKKKDFIKKDFDYIKMNFPNFNNLTHIEKLNFKKTKNRYYHNKDFVRFLKRKIERNSV